MKLSNFACSNLLTTINQLITTAGARAIYDDAGNPREPHLTKALAADIIYGLYKSFSAFIPNYTFAIHGIFCHQFPYAKFADGTNRKCELGDLLFIYDENNKQTGNALLLQAKKINGLWFNPSKTEQKPLALYTQAPEFTYSFSSDKRKIPNRANFSGAQYLLLFPLYDNSSQYRTVHSKYVATKPLINTDFFADSMTGLLCGESGEKFDTNQSDDWSKIIQDFLKSWNNNKKIREQLKKRHYTTGEISPFGNTVLFERKFLNYEPEPARYIEFFITNKGTEIYYPEQNIQDGHSGTTDNTSSENADGKPFLFVHISAIEKDKRER